MAVVDLIAEMGTYQLHPALPAARSRNQRAQLAFEVCNPSIRQGIGELTATRRWIDALVFHCAKLARTRQRCVRPAVGGWSVVGSSWSLSQCPLPSGRRRGTARSPARILVVGTRKDLTVLGEVMKVVGG